MRKALVVGIDYYEYYPALHGCVNDANAVERILARHADNSINFSVAPLRASSRADSVSKRELRDKIKELFADNIEIALFYFAGHGYIEVTGGYIIASNCKSGDEGIPLSYIATLANLSSARHKIIVLDSCFAGDTANNPLDSRIAELAEGVTILAGSTASQYASEENNSGVFTSLLVDALAGAAANIVGEVTSGGIYAHVDQSLGPWEQRPVFKANVRNFESLRKVHPAISLDELRRIGALFPSAGFHFQLDPSFEPMSEKPKKENTEKFAILQKYSRVNLVIPVEAPHMWNAAMEGKSCKLTVLGEHYRRLAEKGLL